MVKDNSYYKLKYLKYKSKYAELKGQNGSECPESNKEYTKAQLIKMGCTKDKFDISSITKDEIDAYNNDNITLADLKKAGFSLLEIITFERKNGIINLDSLKYLKEAGITINEFKNAGLSYKDIYNIGFRADDFKNAGLSYIDIYNIGFRAGDFRNANITATELKNAGLSVYNLGIIGFTCKELKEAGFTVIQIKGTGIFKVNDFKDAGYTLRELLDADFDLHTFVNADFPISDFLAIGITKDKLIKAGFKKEEVDNINVSQILSFKNS